MRMDGRQHWGVSGGTPNLWDMERAGLAERGDARGARSAVTAHLTRHAMEDFLCL